MRRARKNLPHRRERRRKAAKEMEEARAKRSTKEQLNLIEQRRGESKREKARLLS